MYQSHFGLNSQPFASTPDARFIVLTPTHQEALATLVYTMEQREGWALLLGEAGLGKTTLLKALLRQLDPSVTAGVVAHPADQALDLYNQIGLVLGLAGPFERKGLFLGAFEALLAQKRKQGKTVLLALDDAQALSPALLEEVRLLGNADQGEPRMLNIILSARPHLLARMQEGHELDLFQLLHRRSRLTPLRPKDTAHYIERRLDLAGGDPRLFPLESLALIHQASRGVPRYINALCDHCLRQAAQRGEPAVSPDLAREAVQDLPRLEERPGQGWVPREEEPPLPEPAPGACQYFPGPERAWDCCAHPHPRPEINPEEQKLETRLMNRCSTLYQGMPWWEKTTAFSVAWDNLRRRRLGLLDPSFATFCPRWVDDRWEGLNLARRDADYQGAPYDEWIEAQYQRVLGSSLGELPLAELRGPEAAQAWREQAGREEPTNGDRVQAPFDWDDFDPQTPEHQEHADRAIEEIFDLANYVCAQGGKRAEDLVTEAVCQAVLPLDALRSMPGLKEQVAQALAQRRHDIIPPDPPPGGGRPAIII